MILDAIATEQHYLDHILPIWEELPLPERGNLHVPDALAVGLRLRGHTPTPLTPLPWNGRPTLVSAWKDADRARRVGRPVVLMEHGAGQTYEGVENASYAGAPDRRGVTLYLAPSERVAALHTAAHPDIPVEVIGCPKLDALTVAPSPQAGVCVAHHWNCNVAPETRSAWGDFHTAYRPIAATRTLYGHAHPRAPRLSTMMKKHGITYIPTFRDVVETCRVLVVDNSSIGAEWIALDRPIVWLNAACYRRDVHHGGRFWEWAAAGTQVDHPADLADAITEAETTDPHAEARRAIAPTIYANVGSAAAAAAAALRSRLN